MRTPLIDQDTDFRRLAGLAQQRYFIEGKRLDRTRAARARACEEDGVFCRFGRGKTFFQIFLAILIHEKTDRTQIHAIDWLALAEKGVQRLQHETVAAECHNNIGLFRAGIGMAGAHRRQRFGRTGRRGENEGLSSLNSR